MTNNCCIVITTHHEELKDDDELSFKQAIKIFGGNRDIKVVIPNNIDTSYYEKYQDFIEIIKFDNEWFSSSKKYNAMCCQNEFWRLFKDYEYVLTYQTDCWVFEDNLDYFMGLGYDYYGAPWPHHGDMIGNGGFSLRRVSKMLEITEKYEYHEDSLLGNEDTWFCQTHGDELNKCDLYTACNFSMELITVNYLRKIIRCPMGLHSKFVRDLWNDDGYNFIEFKNKILKQ